MNVRHTISTKHVPGYGSMTECSCGWYFATHDPDRKVLEVAIQRHRAMPERTLREAIAHSARVAAERFTYRRVQRQPRPMQPVAWRQRARLAAAFTPGGLAPPIDMEETAWIAEQLTPGEIALMTVYRIHPWFGKMEYSKFVWGAPQLTTDLFPN